MLYFITIFFFTKSLFNYSGVQRIYLILWKEVILWNISAEHLVAHYSESNTSTVYYIWIVKIQYSLSSDIVSCYELLNVACNSHRRVVTVSRLRNILPLLHVLSTLWTEYLSTMKTKFIVICINTTKVSVQMYWSLFPEYFIARWNFLVAFSSTPSSYFRISIESKICKLTLSNILHKYDMKVEVKR